jgi:transcriptional regulatory protein RtcR
MPPRSHRATPTSVSRRPRVLLSFLGMKLDQKERGERRPTVYLCGDREYAFDRLVLLHSDNNPKAKVLATEVGEAAERAAEGRGKRLDVKLEPLHIPDPWDMVGIMDALLDYLHRAELTPGTHDYYVSTTTGTVPIAMSLFLLVVYGHLPATVVQYVALDDPSLDKPTGDRIVTIPPRLDALPLAAFHRPDPSKDAGARRWFTGTHNADYAAKRQELFENASISTNPILLLGETGTGKTLLAREIHNLWLERGLVFQPEPVEVNCASLRGDLLHSELFGHVANVATGVTRDRQGKLLAADDGALFLDEVAEMDLITQGMLLKALEDKHFTPLGSDTPVHSNFQLIAATNADLRKEVRGGRFRKDLYVRLSTWIFHMPPLASRPEDIPDLVEAELSHFLHRKVDFDDDARNAYMGFACSPEARWEGNLRELAMSVHRLAIRAVAGFRRASNGHGRAGDARITLPMVEQERSRLLSEWGALQPAPDAAQRDVVAQALGDESARKLSLNERSRLRDIILACRASRTRTEAGRAVYGPVKNPGAQLQYHLKNHGLSWEALRRRENE